MDIKLLHGDCLELMKDIPDKSVDLILTDPPYRTTSRGSSGGTGGILKEEINKKGMVFQHNTIQFSEWLPKLYSIIKEQGHLYVMVNNKNLSKMLVEVEKAGFKIFKTLIWVKNNSITNMFYMDTHEYIIFARKGKGIKINNCGTKSVLDIKNPSNKVHPTEKPVELMEILINNSTLEGQTVFDPFMGSGTTGVACVNTNRNFIGIELDDKYFEIAKERLQNIQKQITITDWLGESI